MKTSRMVLLLVFCCAVAIAAGACGTIEETTTTTGADATTTLAPTTTAAPETTTTTEAPATTTTTVAPAPGPVAQDKVVKGTWSWDIDSDTDGSSPGADLWWRQASSTERYLVPKNDAEFALLSGETFESLDLADLQAATYSTDPLSASDVGAVIDAGSIVAVHTTEGAYAKLLVTGFQPLEDPPRLKYYIVFSYVLYE